MSRPVHGGILSASLPLDLGEIDPHDPECLTAEFFGSALFEPLFDQTSHGDVYPTLATELPRVNDGRTIVTLRPGLRFSDGRPMDARAVRDSLIRASKLSAPGSSLPMPQLLSRSELAWSGISTSALARQLSLGETAVVPPRFTATSVVTSGALRRAAQSSDALVLDHNPLAPRGGSFVDRVELKARAVSLALRDFESHSGDLALLGRGLHAPRKDSRPFELTDTALVVLQACPQLQGRLRPGSLQAIVQGLPKERLRALGVHGRPGPHQAWGLPATDLWVVASDPWMTAIGQGLIEVWSRSGSPPRLRTASRAAWRQRRTTDDFGLSLTFLRMHPEEAVTVQRLFRLDGKVPPRGRLPSPFDAARQLHSAVLGVLRPTGGVSSQWQDLIRDGRLALQWCSRVHARE